jgi:hypothetical protein
MRGQGNAMPSEKNLQIKILLDPRTASLAALCQAFFEMMDSYKIITRETNRLLAVAAIKRHAALFRVGRILI